jgi:hypothetical protein
LHLSCAIWLLRTSATPAGFAGGERSDGTFGPVFLRVLVAVEALIALYARGATRQGMFE